MATQHGQQQDLGHATDDVERLLTDGVAATVADERGAIVVTVTRFVEPAPAQVVLGDTLTVIAVDGEFDTDIAPLIRAALMRALNGRHVVCCDLSRVTFFGAAAANTVLAVHRHAVELGRPFLIRGVHGLTRRIVDVIDPHRDIARLP